MTVLRKPLSILALCGTLLLPIVLPVSLFTAQADAFIDAEDTVTYRQKAFSMLRDNFGLMSAMVRNDVPYQADTFLSHARSLERIAHLPLAGFQGAGQGVTQDSAAKSGIWNNWDDFETKMNALISATAELAQAAESNDLKTIRPTFMATARTCKQCHDNYREK